MTGPHTDNLDKNVKDTVAHFIIAIFHPYRKTIKNAPKHFGPLLKVRENMGINTLHHIGII